jgi:hypothetical protein
MMNISEFILWTSTFLYRHVRRCHPHFCYRHRLLFMGVVTKYGHQLEMKIEDVHWKTIISGYFQLFQAFLKIDHILPKLPKVSA